MADTVYESFRLVAERHADRTALLHKVGTVYEGISFAALDRMVDEVAAGLAEKGVRPGTRVGIYSYNRPEWVVADLAAMKLGAIVVPVYHTLPADSVRYILNDAEVSHLVVEKPEFLANVVQVMADVPSLREIITLFEDAGAQYQMPSVESRAGREIFSFESLRRTGAMALVKNPASGQPHQSSPDDVVTVVYTSGTTGEPKGAMLTNRNILSNVEAAISRFSISERDVLLSFLPLCHMFERTCGYYCMLLAGATVAYAESLDTVRQDIQQVRPTLLITVPRVLEKVYNAVAEKVRTGPALSRMMMIATLRTYNRCARLAAKRQRPSYWLAFKRWLFGLLVVRKLKKLGGGRIRLMVSGGAPLERRLARIIRNLGFNLLEGYGLTETAPVVCAAVPGEERVGTVGKPFPGVEVRIGKDGEVLVRGPNVMKGYLNKPEETAKVIDTEGWFHTGDQGRFDDSGNLVICGRLKELVVNSYGKNIAPVPIEQALCSSEYVEQAVVIGDRRPYLTALIVPTRLALEDYARTKGIKYDSLTELLGHSEVRRLFEEEITKALANFAPYEQVRAFRLVPEPFTVENGFLTPTLKTRRARIVEAFRDEISRMYAER